MLEQKPKLNLIKATYGPNGKKTWFTRAMSRIT